MSSLRSRFVNNLKPKQAYTSQVERETRAQRKLQDRRNSRAVGFSRNRNIGDSKENIEIEPPQNKAIKDPQRLKLERWKEERKKQKLVNAQKKPAFICGVVRHHVGSPFVSKASSYTGLRAEKMLACAKPAVTSNRKQRPGTRARGTEKQESVQKAEALVAIPANFQFKAPKGIRPLTIPTQPLKPSNTASSKQQPDAKVSQRITRSMAITAQNSSKPTSLQNAQSETSMAKSETYLADAVKSTTTVNESMSLKHEKSVCEAEEKDTSWTGSATLTPVSKTPKGNAEYLPIHYSPFVTKERGGSSRKSMNSSRRDCSVTPNVERTLNTENELETQKERDGVLYFRNILQSEIERLEQTNEKWVALRNSTPDLPEEICDLIDVAVGKSRLLIKQKLNQFATLINQCEAGSVPGMPGVTVKCSDLEGFWDMVYIQVEDVDTKFKMLEDAKSRNWEKDDVPSSQIPSKRERRKPVRKEKKDVAKSSLRAIIAAARKKNQNAVPEVAADVSELITPPRRFSSPVIVNRSSARKSVLQHVLTTEAYKQSLSENPNCSMLELTGIGKDFNSPILLRNDTITRSISDLEEHGVMSNKSNISGDERTPKMDNARQSYKKRLSRKVRFTAEEKNHEDKPVQPMTPYTAVRGRRRSSTVKSENRENLQISLPDITNFSPVERPSRVLRRSRRQKDL